MISMLRELLTFLGAHFYLILIGCGELVLNWAEECKSEAKRS